MTTNKRLTRPVAVALAVAAMMAGLLVAPAAEATPAAPSAPSAPAADTKCVLTGDLCSRTLNSSAYSVLTAKNWGSKTPTRWIGPGGSTPRWEDWDAFRIDAGWCYRFIIWHALVPTWHTSDLRNSSQHEWYQVHDHQTADVYFQSTSSC